MATNSNAILQALLSNSSLAGISSATNTSQDEVSSVLAAALPALLSGAQNQSAQAATSESFANALLSHSQNDTTNLASFFNNVDLDDGNKIVNHLLGNSTAATTKKVAKKASVSSSKTSSILSAAAPLLLALLGKQVLSNKKANSTSAISSLAGSLLGGGDLGTIASAVLGLANTNVEEEEEEDDGFDLADIAGALLGLGGNKKTTTTTAKKKKVTSVTAKKPAASTGLDTSDLASALISSFLGK